LLFDGRDAPFEDGRMLLTISSWYRRKPRAGQALEILGVRRAKAEKGETILDQLGDHLLRDLPTG
jgi:hypothetical protein